MDTARAARLAEYRKKLDALKDVAWKKQDSVNKALTWYALKEGIAIADSGELELQEFKGMLSHEVVKVCAVAFAPREVLIATDKGLISWHRANRFWTLNAPSQDTMNRSAESVEVKDGKLIVVFKGDDNAALTFEQDLKSGDWRETGR